MEANTYIEAKLVDEHVGHITTMVYAIDRNTTLDAWTIYARDVERFTPGETIKSISDEEYGGFVGSFEVAMNYISVIAKALLAAGWEVR